MSECLVSKQSMPASWERWVCDSAAPYENHGERMAADETLQQSIADLFHIAPLTYENRMQVSNLRFHTAPELSDLSADRLNTAELAGDTSWIDDDVRRVTLARWAIYHIEQSQTQLAAEWKALYQSYVQAIRDNGLDATHIVPGDLFELVRNGGATLEDLVYGLALDYAKFAELVKVAQGRGPREEESFYRALQCTYLDVWRLLCNRRRQGNDWQQSWRAFWRLQLSSRSLRLLGCTATDLIKHRNFHELGFMRYLGYAGMRDLGLTRSLLHMVPGLGSGQQLEAYCQQQLGWTHSNFVDFMRKAV